MKFGDVLRYPIRGGWMEEVRFMFVGAGENFNAVLVLATSADDDLWVPGVSIITAGINELELIRD